MNLQAGAPGLHPWRRAIAWLAGLAPFFYLSYGLANHLAAARAAVPSFVFDWERHIPFWDWTVFPYWSLNLFYGLSLFLARSRHELDRHGLRLLTAQCVAVACFIAFPLHFSFGQPEATGAAGWLFAALRSFDQPFNQAPSLHITLVVVLWDLYRRHIAGRLARVMLHGWALAIGVSVLTTWQHHFIDIPSGALLGLLCVWAWPLERRASPLRAWRFTADPQRRRLAARYALGAVAGAMLALAGGGAWLWALWPALALGAVALAYAALGARAFQMSRDGRMAWSVRLLLAPYLLAARANSWWWTRHQPAPREVLPGIWLGSLPRLQAVPPPAQLLSLCAELPAPAGRACTCLPWLDLVPASPQALRRAARAIDAAARGGRPVAVGCALGLSRSVAALACWLVHSGRVAELESALKLLRRAQPGLVLGRGWLAALQQALHR